jgi:multicomponent K+:H+ antiporter subunit D
MNHWIIAPILVPALTAIALLLTARADRNMHRALSVLATLGTLAVAMLLAGMTADGTRHVYALGDWPVPFGIVLVADRLSALLVLLTSFVGLGALLHAIHGWDERGRNFHALFQFQLMGLNNAFLTGDIFNLFVSFEILLIASYALLLHGGGAERVRAGVHYVAINLVGSALFITALGLIYGTMGTLNMADIAARIGQLDPGDVPIARSAFLLLIVVFAIKAAALPLYFWLPSAYSAASAPVASLFAIMTKVGVYAILRVSTLFFGEGAGALAGLGAHTLLWVGVATSIAAALGVLAARDLRHLVSYLVIASVGLLLIGLGLPGVEARAALVYYLVHSTLVAAGFFLLVEAIGTRRGALDTAITHGVVAPAAAVVGTLYFVYAMAAVGLPPLSGFLGKVLVLRAAVADPAAPALFAVILGAGLVALVAVSRAGTTVFWKGSDAQPPSTAAAAPAPIFPAALHLVAVAALVLGAGPALEVAGAIAAQLGDAAGYIEAVFAHPSVGRS